MVVFARSRWLVSLLLAVLTGCLGGQGGAPGIGDYWEGDCLDRDRVQAMEAAKALEQYTGHYEGTGLWYTDQTSPGMATWVEISLFVDGELPSLGCHPIPARAARLHLRTEDGVDLELDARITKQGEGAEVVWPAPSEDPAGLPSADQAAVSRGRLVFVQGEPDLLDARVEERTLRSITLTRSASE